MCAAGRVATRGASDVTRAADKPIGRITKNGYGVGRAAGAIHWYVLYEGPQAAFIDADGRVLCVPVGTATELRLLAQHIDWFIGRYDCGLRTGRKTLLSRESIVGDLRARARELFGVAA